MGVGAAVDRVARSLKVASSIRVPNRLHISSGFPFLSNFFRQLLGFDGSDEPSVGFLPIRRVNSSPLQSKWTNLGDDSDGA